MSYKIALISTFPPTQCGIASYADDLIRALENYTTEFKFVKCELGVENENIHTGEVVIKNDLREQFYLVSNYINNSNIDLVDLQHEFKIYGKPDGENVSILLEEITKPIITTLHTISPYLNEKKEFCSVFYKVL